MFVIFTHSKTGKPSLIKSFDSKPFVKNEQNADF